MLEAMSAERDRQQETPPDSPAHQQADDSRDALKDPAQGAAAGTSYTRGL